MLGEGTNEWNESATTRSAAETRGHPFFSVVDGLYLGQSSPAQQYEVDAAWSR